MTSDVRPTGRPRFTDPEVLLPLTHRRIDLGGRLVFLPRNRAGHPGPGHDNPRTLIVQAAKEQPTRLCSKRPPRCPPAVAPLGVEPLGAADAARIRGGIPGSEAPGGVIHGDVVYELTWDGDVVWRWAAIDHLNPELTTLNPHFAREHWPMANTVNELRDGGIVVGFRSASTTVAVDRTDGSVRWRIGPDVLAQQHYPHELADGNILVFDNGTYRDTTSVPYSRVVEIDPADGRTVWTYEDNPPQNFYSPYMSSAQRLPNGNTFIAEGSFGRLFEVTPDGDVVWEFVVPEFGAFGRGVGLESSRGAQNAVFRAYRYSAEQIPWL
ncbi:MULTISPECIES: aryl-sulfate sulfotransferase [unclassified Kitasatospora]|uniref:aryl-sulfate sulfotransferase n=1 Tax=unclassified Kitasatospora TaxID=2633591 RepID=UPI0033D9BF96